MKITWEILNDKVRIGGLNKELTYYPAAPKFWIAEYALEYATGCLWCGKDFLKPIKQEAHYCDKECRHEHALWKLAEKRAKSILFNSNRKKEIQASKCVPVTKVTNTDWSTKYGALYNVHSYKLKGIDAIRRHPDNYLVIQVKCVICGEWITPTRQQVNNRFHYITNTHKLGNSDAYVWLCSEDCRNKCPEQRLNSRQEELYLLERSKRKLAIIMGRVKKKEGPPTEERQKGCCLLYKIYRL